MPILNGSVCGPTDKNDVWLERHKADSNLWLTCTSCEALRINVGAAHPNLLGCLDFMIISFIQKGLERIYRPGKLSGIQPKHIKRLRLILTILD